MKIIGNYSKIQSMKRNQEFIFDNINFFKVIGMKLYEKSYIYTFKTFLLAIFFETKLNYDSKDNKILISFPFKKGKRNDYDYILSKLKEILDKNNLGYNDLFFLKKLSIKNIIFNIYIFLKFYKKNNFLKSYEDRIRITALESFYFRLYKKIKNLNFESQILISFCDAHPEDNLLTQLFKNNDKKTLTLQHGQYRVLSSGNINADVEAYENFISDYLLAWGEATLDEFKKAGIESSRIKVVGALKEFSFNDKMKVTKNSTEVFGVILDGETYRKSNINMIKVANKISEELNMKYIIRLHPNNNKKIYEKFKNNKCKEVTKINNEKKYINMIDFNIIHMTGVFIELLSYNSPFFLYDDIYMEEIFKISEMVSFVKYKDFKEKYNFYKKNKNKYLKILQDNYLYFNNNQNIELNYINVIKNILEE